jgi:hypothetical protein
MFSPTEGRHQCSGVLVAGEAQADGVPGAVGVRFFQVARHLEHHRLGAGRLLDDVDHPQHLVVVPTLGSGLSYIGAQRAAADQDLLVAPGC